MPHLYDEYMGIAPKIFGKDAKKSYFPILGEKFSATKFRDTVQEVLDRLAPEDQQLPTAKEPIS